jgi:hypothetical protein
MEYRVVKFQELRKFQHQFRTALQQVSVMDEKVTDLMKRYVRAYHLEMYILCEHIDIRITVTENIRNIYAEFTLLKSKQVETVFTDLFLSFKGE